MQANPVITPAGRTATLVILIGLVFEGLEALVLVTFSFYAIFFPYYGLYYLILAGFAVLWVILVYAFAYLPTSRGYYAQSRMFVLIIAILCLITLSLLPAILYFIGYAQIGTAIQQQAQAGGAPATPPGATPPAPPA